jgi:DNA sulfur modification protein DndB
MAVGTLSFPAIVGQQGDRKFYQLILTNKELTTRFTTSPCASPNEKSQRELDSKHAAKIAKYIVDNPQEYALGSLTYAVDQPCHFVPNELGSNVGILHIPASSSIHSLDGQHRRKGLTDALLENCSIANECSAVMLYEESNPDKRRQMFSDFNSTPKKVSAALTVQFDSRNPYKRAAKTIVAEHHLLEGVVEMTHPSIVSGSDKIWTLGGISDALERLHPAFKKARQMTPEAYGPILDRAHVLFDILHSARIELCEAQCAPAEIPTMRTENILFSSVTLRAIAGALGEIYKVNGGVLSDDLIEDITDRLSEVDFSPGNSIWSECGFLAPGTSTPSSRLQEIKAGTQVLVKLLS